MEWNIYTILAVIAVGTSIYFFIFSFAKVFKLLVRFLLKTALGACGILAFNYIASAYSLSIGLNAYTCSLCGVLGLPGYILMVGTRLLFL